MATLYFDSPPLEAITKAHDVRVAPSIFDALRLGQITFVIVSDPNIEAGDRVNVHEILLNSLGSELSGRCIAEALVRFVLPIGFVATATGATPYMGVAQLEFEPVGQLRQYRLGPKKLLHEAEWTKPHYGVSHLQGLKREFQITITERASGVWDLMIFNRATSPSKSEDVRFASEHDAKTFAVARANDWGLFAEAADEA